MRCERPLRWFGGGRGSIRLLMVSGDVGGVQLNRPQCLVTCLTNAVVTCHARYSAAGNGHFYQAGPELIYLLTAYAKADREDLSSADKKVLSRLVAAIKKEEKIR